MVCGVGRRGLTLLELMVVLGLLSAFLALAYKPLETLILYPRRSEVTFSDRAAVCTAERLLLRNLQATEKGYLWVAQARDGISILMGQALEYRAPKESPITSYELIHYDTARCVIERWALAPDLVNKIAGGPPQPKKELEEEVWTRLLAEKERSLVATHVTAFSFEKGSKDTPCSFMLEVSTPNWNLEPGKPKGPAKRVARFVGLVGNGRS